MTISRHPGPFRRSSPVFSGESDALRTLRSTRSPTVFTADARSELDPRSLDPAALFGARLPSLFEARRSLMTSATALTTCGQPNPGPFDPRRDGDLDLLPFLLRVTPSRLRVRVTRGEPRSVRPSRPQCWFLSLARVCPTVMPPPPPHLRGLRPRSIVRIDVHGSKDRVKDASPGACNDVSCLRRVHAHRSRMLTAFPSSASSGHPLSSARLMSREDCPRPESDRPRPSFRWRPAKSATFQKTGMP
jgi:hypothetical protein